MKVVSLFFAFLFTSVVFAQIPNASFENWQSVPGALGAEDPVGWTSNNIICDTVQGYAIRKSSVARTGSYALEIRPSCRNGTNNYASLHLGEAQIDSLYPNFLDSRCAGSPINSTPYIIAGYYQYYLPNPATPSAATITATVLTDKCGGSFGTSPPPVWGNEFFTTTTTLPLGPSSFAYRPFAFPLSCQIDSTPVAKHLTLQFFMNNSDTLVVDQKYLLIDDLSLHGNLLTVPQENLAGMFQVYPNPVKDFVKLKKPDFLEVTQIDLYNANGKHLLNSKACQAELNLAHLKVGLYVLRIATAAGYVTKRLVKK